MKFPKTLKVAAITYKILVDPENQRWHEYDEEYGHIDYETRTIALSTKYTDEQKRDSLIHEIVHAIAKHMNLGDAWGDNNENYVRRLTNGLNMIFRDNPELVKLLGE